MSLAVFLPAQSAGIYQQDNLTKLGTAVPLLEYGKGKVVGHTRWSAMGEYESGNVNVSGEDVVRHEDVGGPVRLPTPSTAGEQITVISTDAEDGVAGDGVITLRLEYIDTAYKQQTEDITTNGLTGVDTVATDIIFINDMYALTVGATGVAEGHITAYKKGGAVATDLYQFIVAGGNKSLVPHRMVPDGKTLYLKSWHCEQSTQGKRAAYRIRSTDMYGDLIPGVFCFKDTAQIGQAATGDMDLHYTPVPARSIVKISHWSDTAGTEGSCGWNGVLVDN